MPLVEVNIAKGKDKNHLLQLMNETMNSVQQILQLPEDDRNIRLSEYDADLFQMKAPYKILIQIDMFLGRTVETKRKLYKLLVDNLNNKLQIDPKEVFILINEQPRENWGVRGGVAASDIQLDFKVEV
jgi:4-oxalocrotonate tautomerase family enzyme